MHTKNILETIESYKTSVKPVMQVDEDNTRETSSGSNLKGILIMIVSSLLFGLLGFSIQLTLHNVPEVSPFDILFVRSVMMLVAYGAFAAAFRVNLAKISFQNLKTLLLCSICSTLAMCSLYVSIDFLPASIAFMIFNANPIFVFLLAYLLLGEKFPLSNLVCVLGAFGGIVFVSIGRSDQHNSNDNEFLGVILCSLAALGASISYICMKKINQAVHYLFPPFYIAVTTMGLLLLVYLLNLGAMNIEKYDTRSILYMSSCGVFSLTGQLLMSLAYKYANATMVSPLMYINCLFNVITDLVYFQYDFYITDLYGGILITTCVFIPVILLIFSQRKKI